MRFAIPVILIIIAIGGFFMYTSPLYTEISVLRTQIASYNEALNNSKSLEAERDKLVQKYNSINPDDLSKLQKMLPDTVNNIRLILEIEKLALPYGMVLKDVKYDTTTVDPTAPPTIQAKPAVADTKDYGIWNLEFSTQGSYFDFINFTKDLEKNLRIVDISAIQFSSDTGSLKSNAPSAQIGAQTTGINIAQPSNIYKYGFKIKTYWLKN